MKGVWNCMTQNDTQVRSTKQKNSKTPKTSKFQMVTTYKHFQISIGIMLSFHYFAFSLVHHC